MKIRGDFVANSSSYSSVIIRIQSKELAEFLKEYQELFYKDDVQIQPDGIFVDVVDGCESAPQSLEQLIDKLSAGLEGEIRVGLLDNPLVRRLGQEMKAKERELTDSIQSVEWNWDFHNYDYDEFEGIGRKRFVYHRDEGGSGAYWEEPYSEDDDEIYFDREEEE